MTIVLGRRPVAQPTDSQQRREDWVNHFKTQVQEPEIAPVARASTTQAPIGGPAPVPLAEIRGKHRGIYASARRFRAASPDGVVGLYASRIDAQKALRLNRIESPTRLQTRSIGRGSDAHYETLHPNKCLEISVPEFNVTLPSVKLPVSRPTEVRATLQRSFVSFWQGISGITLKHGHRLSYSRRAMLASLAAFVLMAGMATSTLAAQQLRYEVREGDSLESIASEFGVDPEAIYRSSWMPNGWEVAPGQVIVIPEPGQSPEAAALQAAELEGTSPWTAGAHEVVWGDTLGSIAWEWDVPVDHLIAFNPDLDPNSLIPGQRVIIPWERGDDTVGPIVTSEPTVMLPVPNFVQSRNLSCEFAATHAATAAFGPGIAEQTFIDSVPVTLNPHLGYRGNIDGSWGNTDDYGVYASPLIPVLNANGYIGESFYSMGDTEILRAHLDAGHPVVVWLGFWGDTRERLNDEGEYSVFAGMHVVTAIGYDDNGVYVMDPAKGEVDYYDWATFSAMWSIVDGMGLAVYPA